MKNFLKSILGLPGLLIYFLIAFIIRIPVGIFLWLFLAGFLLVWTPLTGKDSTPKWSDRLYNWYLGK